MSLGSVSPTTWDMSREQTSFECAGYDGCSCCACEIIIGQAFNIASPTQAQIRWSKMLNRSHSVMIWWRLYYYPYQCNRRNVCTCKPKDGDFPNCSTSQYSHRFDKMIFNKIPCIWLTPIWYDVLKLTLISIQRTISIHHRLFISEFGIQVDRDHRMAALSRTHIPDNHWVGFKNHQSSLIIELSKY